MVPAVALILWCTIARIPLLGPLLAANVVVAIGHPWPATGSESRSRVATAGRPRSWVTTVAWRTGAILAAASVVGLTTHWIARESPPAMFAAGAWFDRWGELWQLGAFATGCIGIGLLVVGVVAESSAEPAGATASAAD